MTDYISQTILKMGAWSNASDSCFLQYEDRFLRRKVLKTVKGASLLVDLATYYIFGQWRRVRIGRRSGH